MTTESTTEADSLYNDLEKKIGKRAFIKHSRRRQKSITSSV